MSAIVSATVSKKAYPRNQDIIKFFESVDLYRNTDEFKQFTKLEDETEELYEALRHKPKSEILSEAGDVYICLLNILYCCDLTMEDAVNSAANKVTKRKGQMVDGLFEKES